MSTITEHKKEILLDLLKQAEGKLCELLHHIENDSTVPNQAWEEIDHESSDVFHLIEQIRDELIFS